MKKLFLFLILALPYKLHATADWYGNQYVNTAVWRSSVTCAAEANVAITTQSVNFGGAQIASTGTSVVAFYDGSFNVQVASFNSINTTNYPYGAGIHFSSAGLYVNDPGTTPPCLEILWQYQFKPDAGK